VKKLLFLLAAVALAGSLAAMQAGTGPVFTTTASGSVVDQSGNSLTQIGPGQYTDKAGKLYTVDPNGRLVDPNGVIVSAPGVVIDAGQSSFTGTAPSLPGQNNPNITLGPAAAPQANPPSQVVVIPAGGATGTNASVSGQVVGYDAGRAITIQQQNGLKVTFPLAATTVLPPSILPGTNVTITTSQTAPGVSTVTRVSTGAATTLPVAAASAPAPAGRTGKGGGYIQTSNGTRTTVSAGARTSVVKRDVVYTVRSFDRSTLVLVSPKGTLRRLRVGSGSTIPADLAPGRQVVVTTKSVSGSTVVGTVTYYPVTVKAS
jgi:hypothetical protein